MDHGWLDTIRHHEGFVWYIQYEGWRLHKGDSLHVYSTLQLLIKLFHVQLLKVVEGHEPLNLLESLKLYRVT
jgi:hypothetical protein